MCYKEIGESWNYSSWCLGSTSRGTAMRTCPAASAQRQFVMIQQNANRINLLQAQATGKYGALHTLAATEIQTISTLMHFTVQSHWQQDTSTEFHRGKSASWQLSLATSCHLLLPFWQRQHSHHSASNTDNIRTLPASGSISYSKSLLKKVWANLTWHWSSSGALM